MKMFSDFKHLQSKQLFILIKRNEPIHEDNQALIRIADLALVKSLSLFMNMLEHVPESANQINNYITKGNLLF